MIESWIDIPNVETVDLPEGSFYGVESKSITSIYMNINEWIDVHKNLANPVKFNGACTIFYYSCCKYYFFWILLSMSILISYFIC